MDPLLGKSKKRKAAILSDGYRLRVGSGNISLWYDRWLEEGLLCDVIPFVHIEDTQMRIADLYSRGTWQFNKLATILPSDMMDMILPFLLLMTHCWRSSWFGLRRFLEVIRHA